MDVQNWARQNTPQEAVFITPPQEVGLYTPDWRTFSERGTVAELYDLFEIALKPDYLAVWQPRFEALAPGALERFNGNFFENQAIIRQAYNGLSTSDFLAIACRYKAAYLVMEQAAGPAGGDLPVVYENEQYRVYDLRPRANCQIN